MLSVQLDLKIVAKDSVAHFVRHTALPFAPFVGLRITWMPDGKTDPSDEVSIHAKSIEWDQPLGVFIVSDETNWSSGPCQCTPGDDCCTLANLIRAFAPPGSGLEMVGEPRPLYSSEIEGNAICGLGWPEVTKYPLRLPPHGEFRA